VRRRLLIHHALASSDLPELRISYDWVYWAALP
jgi:hypothetical protein